MPGKLSKLTRRLMGRRSGVAANSAAEETEVLESSVLRSKIGYLSAMELFRDFTPAEMEEIVRATRMQTCKSGREPVALIRNFSLTISAYGGSWLDPAWRASTTKLNAGLDISHYHVSLQCGWRMTLS